jgi:restriction endonuclease S subunit
MTPQTNLQNWKEKKFDEVFNILGGNAAPKKENLGGEIDFVRMQDLGRVKDKIYVSDVKDKVSKNIINNEKLKIFKAGSILIPRSGSVHLNHRAILKEDSCVVSHIVILENKNEKEFSTKFLYYLLTTIDMRQIMHQTTGLNLIRFEDLKQLKLLIPSSLPLQSFIVSAIESRFSKIDNAIKNLKSAKSKIQLYRKAVLKRAFEKGKDWEEKKIKDICDLINGKAFKSNKWAREGLPIIRIKNLNNEDSKFNYCNFKVEDKYYLDDGQLLFAWSGTPETSFGAHIWKRGKAVLNQHIFKVNVDEKKIDKIFLMYLFNKNVQEYVAKAHGTAGLAHITKKKFEESNIAFPPSLSSQQSIVSSIESKFSVIDKVEEVVDNSLKKAEKLKKSILKSAFEGKLVKGEEKE